MSTNSQVIPEAAVEAAAEDLYDREGYSTSLADAPKYRRDRFLTQARKALEAAAPHFASAWHDAVSNAYVDGALSADQAGVMYGANPYRTAK